MNLPSTNQLKLKYQDYTLWIVLNRPEASNAFTIEMIEELVSTLYMADSDSSVRCIVITGEGKHFCAGGDIKDMENKVGMFSGEPNELRERYKYGIQRIPVCMESLSTPVVGMINGAAIGAGLDLACMCDIRLASDKAVFGETFVKLGLIPGDGGSYFLQRVVGYAKAMELTLTGNVIKSDEALKFGLVSDIYSGIELEQKTQELVSRITSNAPVAVQMAKRAIIHGYRNHLASQLDLLASFQGISQRTQDHFEALKSFQNKVKPDFSHQ